MRKIRLTEADLYKIVKRVLKEDEDTEIESQIETSDEYSELSDTDIQEWNSTQISWRKAIKECLSDLDSKYNTTRYSNLPKKYIAILSFAAFVFGLGMFTNIKELKFMSLITLLGTAVLSHPELQEIIICAVNKRKGGDTPSTPIEPMEGLIESAIKKSLRKIIREQENLPFRINKTVQDIINTKRFNELQEGMMVSVKNNIVDILPTGGESNEEYVVDIRPKTFPNMVEQQTKMIVKGGKLNIKFIDGKILSLDPQMKVIKFNI